MHTYAHIRWFLKSSHVLHNLKWVRDVACVTGKLHTQSNRKSNGVSVRKNGKEKAAEDKDSADGSQGELGSESENPRRQNDMGKITRSNPSVD